jgi:hypothetical protein
MLGHAGNEQRQTAGSLLINILRYRLQISVWPSAAAGRNGSLRGKGARAAVAAQPRAAVSSTLPELYRDAVGTMYHEVDGNRWETSGSSPDFG